MANVYITHEANQNFMPAERFGEIHFLCSHDINNLKNSLFNQEQFALIKHRLRNFNAEVDYILIAGSPYVNAAVFVILGLMQCKYLRVLRWSKRDQSYNLMHLELKEIFHE